MNTYSSARIGPRCSGLLPDMARCLQAGVRWDDFTEPEHLQLASLAFDLLQRGMLLCLLFVSHGRAIRLARLHLDRQRLSLLSCCHKICPRLQLSSRLGWQDRRCMGGGAPTVPCVLLHQ